jgi:hypothetical protein
MEEITHRPHIRGWADQFVKNDFRSGVKRGQFSFRCAPVLAGSWKDDSPKSHSLMWDCEGSSAMSCRIVNGKSGHQVHSLRAFRRRCQISHRLNRSRNGYQPPWTIVARVQVSIRHLERPEQQIDEKTTEEWLHPPIHRRRLQ